MHIPKKLKSGEKNWIYHPDPDSRMTDGETDNYLKIQILAVSHYYDIYCILIHFQKCKIITLLITSDI